MHVDAMKLGIADHCFGIAFDLRDFGLLDYYRRPFEFDGQILCNSLRSLTRLLVLLSKTISRNTPRKSSRFVRILFASIRFDIGVARAGAPCRPVPASVTT